MHENHDNHRPTFLSDEARQLFHATDIQAELKKLMAASPEFNFKFTLQEALAAKGFDVLSAGEKADEILGHLSAPEAANDGAHEAGLAFVDGLDAAAKEKKKPPKPRTATLARLEKLLTKEKLPYAKLFRLNEMTGEIELTAAPPWHSNGKTLEEADISEFRAHVEKRHKLIAPPNLAWEAIAMVAARNAYNPLRDYVQGLEWDGTERIDTWLIEYAGAEDTPLVRSMSAKFLIAMVARAIKPGEQVDTMLVLQGPQGTLKSTLLRTLAGDEWFSDADIDFHNKDTFELLRYCWLVEMGELAALNRRDAETAKAFITRREDMFRVSYGRKNQRFPRHCVFAGTTNHDEFLRDPTGNRRYWTIKVTRCSPLALAEVRDQLFAEARIRFERGDNWHLSFEQGVELAKTQESVTCEPVFVPLIAAEIERAGLFRTLQPAQAFMSFLEVPSTPQNIQLFCQALRHLGYKMKHTRKGNMWEPSEELLAKHPSRSQTPEK